MTEQPADLAAPRRCALHRSSDAEEVCARCGAFLCAECRRPLEGALVCAGCEERRANRPPSGEANLALTLALLGFAGLLPGIVGGLLAWRELRRIRAGTAPTSSEGYARLACALGALYAVALAAALGWAALEWLGY